MVGDVGDEREEGEPADSDSGPKPSLVRARRADLKPRLLSVLKVVAEMPNVTVSELESRFGVSRRSVQRYPRDLVDRGLIRETGTSVTDPRKTYAVL